MLPVSSWTIRVPADRTRPEAILLNLAFNHIRLGDPSEAIEKFEVLQKEFPNSPQNDGYLYRIIYASVRKNKVPNAKKFLAELKAKFPSSKYIEPAEKAISEGFEDSKKQTLTDGRSRIAAGPTLHPSSLFHQKLLSH